jgi:hypothetical protein
VKFGDTPNNRPYGASMRFHASWIAALAVSASASAQSVVFLTGSDNGFFTPFNSGNAATVKYGDSGWLGGPSAPPVALGTITLYLATFSNGAAVPAGSTDIELTINDGDPSGLVFGSGAELYRVVINDVELPATDGSSASFFAVSVPLPRVLTSGGFNNVGWSVRCLDFQFGGSFGFQVGTCNAQLIGFFTNNASFFNGTSWSLFAFGANTCSQIAQYSVEILDAAESPCPADFDGDGTVGGADLTTLLAGWGSSSADIDGDGTTNGTDLTTLLAGWGPCV